MTSTVELRERVRALSLEQKVRLLTGADFWSLHPEPGAGLRRVVLSDGPAGVRGETFDERDPSANVPCPTALAASWDEAQAHRIGQLLAAEARRKGVDVLLAPTVNLHRTPYGGRHFECFSEDPLVTGRIAAAYVRGVQSGGVGATVKHFVANDSETERMTLDARVDERALREVYLAPFETLVTEAEPWAVMAAYNGVNGSTMTEHGMLNDVLKQEWGFDGVVVSDWYATRSTVDSGCGGLDLVMPGPDGPWGAAMVAAVRAGHVPESAVDEKVLRLLRLADRVAALDGAQPPQPEQPATAVELRRAATAGFVLARNDGPVLPLDATKLRKVAVLGPNAATARTLGGGSATVFPPYTVSPLEGLRSALGPHIEITHSVGVRASTRLAPATPELLTNPDTGEPGVSVRFLDADDALVGKQHRTSGRLIWMGSFDPDVPLDAVAMVEVRARLRAAESGEYHLGCAGVGRFLLAAGDDVLIDGKWTLPPGGDLIDAMARPPERTSSVTLRAGDEIEVVLRHQVDPGAISTSFRLGVEPPSLAEDDELERAVALAASADAAVVVVGTSEETESEGFDRDTLALPRRQDELVRRVASANPRTVVVVNSGAPVLLPWADEVPAVLLSWFAGQEYGNALADVLTGAAEPGGRLPMTWPASADDPLPTTQPRNGVLRYGESIYIGHRGYDREGVDPAFCLGHGLGYTTWEYECIETPENVWPGADAVVEVRVRNTGDRPGREVVQAYLSRSDSAVERPVRWLAGFAVVEAGPGDLATAELRIPARAFQHWQDQRWNTEPGSYTLQVGSSSRNLSLEGAMRIPSL